MHIQGFSYQLGKWQKTGLQKFATLLVEEEREDEVCELEASGLTAAGGGQGSEGGPIRPYHRSPGQRRRGCLTPGGSGGWGENRTSTAILVSLHTQCVSPY